MIRKLWLNGFRNFTDTLLDLSNNKTIIVFGKNNQGKTNLLESIYFMIHGKSPRDSHLEHLIQFDFPESHLGASIELDGQLKKLYVRLQQDGQKIITLDDSVYKTFSQIKKQVNLAYLSADVIRVIQESPGSRRSFLDDFLIGYYPAYGQLLKKYKNCITQKNQLLKQGADKSSLIVWNQSLVALAEELVRYRFQGAQIITDSLKQLFIELDLDISSDVKLNYIIPKYFRDEDQFVDDYRSFLEKRLLEGLMKEKSVGYSLYGPHRHDFSIDIQGKSLFHFFSRGINRIVAILLTLSSLSLKQTQSGAYPILLLDDTFAELDSDMKKRLMIFMQSKTQLFYATVLPEDKLVLTDTRILEIDSGSIKVINE